ncbi:MAG: hypothetical protein HPY66_0943 [Firmicutes bacterium]|nr:hypothetical protein [Bacillota bacterium]MDI6707023.1 hypothetical protein [Bacillota bacterium]
MLLQNGDTLLITAGGQVQRCRISKVDGNVVKLFDEAGSYRQMPYTILAKMIEEGQAVVQRNKEYDF